MGQRTPLLSERSRVRSSNPAQPTDLSVHRIIETITEGLRWEGNFKMILFQPKPWAGTLSTIPGCSKLRHFQGWESPPSQESLGIITSHSPPGFFFPFESQLQRGQNPQPVKDTEHSRGCSHLFVGPGKGQSQPLQQLAREAGRAGVAAEAGVGVNALDFGEAGVGIALKKHTRSSGLCQGAAPVVAHRQLPGVLGLKG